MSYSDYKLFCCILSAAVDDRTGNEAFLPEAIDSFLRSQVMRWKSDELCEAYLDMHHMTLNEYVETRVDANLPLLFSAAVEAAADKGNGRGRHYIRGTAITSPYVEVWEQGGTVYVGTILNTQEVGADPDEHEIEQAIVKEVSALYAVRLDSSAIWDEEARGFIHWSRRDVPAQLEYIEGGDEQFILDDEDRIIGLLTDACDEETEPVDDLYCRIAA